METTLPADTTKDPKGKKNKSTKDTNDPKKETTKPRAPRKRKKPKSDELVEDEDEDTQPAKKSRKAGSNKNERKEQMQALADAITDLRPVEQLPRHRNLPKGVYVSHAQGSKRQLNPNEFMSSRSIIAGYLGFKWRKELEAFINGRSCLPFLEHWAKIKGSVPVTDASVFKILEDPASFDRLSNIPQSVHLTAENIESHFSTPADNLPSVLVAHLVIRLVKYNPAVFTDSDPFHFHPEDCYRAYLLVKLVQQIWKGPRDIGQVSFQDDIASIPVYCDPATADTIAEAGGRNQAQGQTLDVDAWEAGLESDLKLAELHERALSRPIDDESLMDEETIANHDRVFSRFSGKTNGLVGLDETERLKVLPLLYQSMGRPVEVYGAPQFNNAELMKSTAAAQKWTGAQLQHDRSDLAAAAEANSLYANAAAEQPTAYVSDLNKEMEHQKKDQHVLLGRIKPKGAKTLSYREACILLGLDPADPGRPARPGALLPEGYQPFKSRSWQVIGSAWLIQQELSRSMKGCLLADDMGLGKTVTALGYIHHMSQVDIAKLGLKGFFPTIMVTPPALVQQSVNEYELRWAPHSHLKLLVYHLTRASIRRESNILKYHISTEDLIRALLIPGGMLDSTNPETANYILLTSYTTFAHRTVITTEEARKLAKAVEFRYGFDVYRDIGEASEEEIEDDELELAEVEFETPEDEDLQDPEILPEDTNKPGDPPVDGVQGTGGENPEADPEAAKISEVSATGGSKAAENNITEETTVATAETAANTNNVSGADKTTETVDDPAATVKIAKDGKSDEAAEKGAAAAAAAEKKKRDEAAIADAKRIYALLRQTTKISKKRVPKIPTGADLATDEQRANVRKAAKKLLGSYTSLFKGRFARAVLDECTDIKNSLTQANLAITLADCPFHVFISGTPTPNKVIDLAALLKLSMPDDVEDPDDWIKAAEGQHQTLPDMLGQQAVARWYKTLDPTDVRLLNPIAFQYLCENGNMRPEIALEVLPCIYNLFALTRTAGDEIILHDGTTEKVGGDIPPYELRQIRIMPPEAERARFAAIHERYKGFITIPGPGGDSSAGEGSREGRHNMGAVRLLCHSSFATCLNQLSDIVQTAYTREQREAGVIPSLHDKKKRADTSDAVSGWFGGDDCGASFLISRILRDPDIAPNAIESASSRLFTLAKKFPKLAHLTGPLHFHCTLRNEKVIIVADWPMIRWVAHVFCALAGFPTLALTADMDEQERSEVIQKWNNVEDHHLVLVTTARLVTFGHNLHNGRCHVVIILEALVNYLVMLQIVCRVHRLGQKSKQFVYHYYGLAGTDEYRHFAATLKLLGILCAGGDKAFDGIVQKELTLTQDQTPQDAAFAYEKRLETAALKIVTQLTGAPKHSYLPRYRDIKDCGLDRHGNRDELRDSETAPGALAQTPKTPKKGRIGPHSRLDKKPWLGTECFACLIFGRDCTLFKEGKLVEEDKACKHCRKLALDIGIPDALPCFALCKHHFDTQPGHVAKAAWKRFELPVKGPLSRHDILPKLATYLEEKIKHADTAQECRSWFNSTIRKHIEGIRLGCPDCAGTSTDPPASDNDADENSASDIEELPEPKDDAIPRECIRCITDEARGCVDVLLGVQATACDNCDTGSVSCITPCKTHLQRVEQKMVQRTTAETQLEVLREELQNPLTDEADEPKLNAEQADLMNKLSGIEGDLRNIIDQSMERCSKCTRRNLKPGDRDPPSEKAADKQKATAPTTGRQSKTSSTDDATSLGSGLASKRPFSSRHGPGFSSDNIVSSTQVTEQLAQGHFSRRLRSKETQPTSEVAPGHIAQPDAQKVEDATQSAPGLNVQQSATLTTGAHGPVQHIPVQDFAVDLLNDPTSNPLVPPPDNPPPPRSRSQSTASSSSLSEPPPRGTPAKPKSRKSGPAANRCARRIHDPTSGKLRNCKNAPVLGTSFCKTHTEEP